LNSIKKICPLNGSLARSFPKDFHNHNIKALKIKGDKRDIRDTFAQKEYGRGSFPEAFYLTNP
jgi:hypothetical protein